MDCMASMKDGTSTKETIQIANTVLDFVFYKRKDVSLSSQADVTSLFSQCTLDGPMQVILCYSLLVKEGVILCPPLRCKGLAIFALSNLTNKGTISMSGRGCKAIGQNIMLYKLKDFEAMVPAVGGKGGDGYNVWGKWILSNGRDGVAGVGRQTGGGGSGAARSYIDNCIVGRGGYGTSYSGGAGSGGVATDRGGAASSLAAPDDGGAGTDGNPGWGNPWGRFCTGGAGNPHGTHRHYGWGGGTILNKGDGTGGLLIIFTAVFDNRGLISADGYPGYGVAVWEYCECETGGSAGGGSINIFYGVLLSRGAIQAKGGNLTEGFLSDRKGGAGGDGTVSLDAIKFFYYLLKRNNEILLE